MKVQYFLKMCNVYRVYEKVDNKDIINTYSKWIIWINELSTIKQERTSIYIIFILYYTRRARSARAKACFGSIEIAIERGRTFKHITHISTSCCVMKKWKNLRSQLAKFQSSKFPSQFCLLELVSRSALIYWSALFSFPPRIEPLSSKTNQIYLKSYIRLQKKT